MPRPAAPSRSGVRSPRRILHLEEVLAVVLQLLDRLVDVGERLVLAVLGEALGEFRLPALAPVPSAWRRRGCGSGSRPRAAASSARGSGGPGRSSCRTSARCAPARAAARNASMRSSTSASTSGEALHLVDRARSCACVPLFQSSMPSSTASGWCTTSTGASATVSSCASVTTIATSMMRSVSGARPVISMSIQTRLFWSCGMCVPGRGDKKGAVPGTAAALDCLTGHLYNPRHSPSDASLHARLSRRARRHGRHAAVARAAPDARTSPRTATRCRRVRRVRSRSTSHQKAADYTVAKTRLGMVETVVGAAAAARVHARRRPAGAVRTSLRACARSRAASRTASRFMAGVAIVGGVVDLPFTLYRTFVIEARFGFNRMTLAPVPRRPGQAARWSARCSACRCSLAVLWLMDAHGRASGGSTCGWCGSASTCSCW